MRVSARRVIAAACILLLSAAALLSYASLNARPTYNATVIRDGQLYVIDHDLTLDDCLALSDRMSSAITVGCFGA